MDNANIDSDRRHWLASIQTPEALVASSVWPVVFEFRTNWPMKMTSQNHYRLCITRVPPHFCCEACGLWGRALWSPAPWCGVVPQKPVGFSYSSQRFTTMLTRAHCWPLSWTTWINPSPTLISQRFVLSIILTPTLGPHILTETPYVFPIHATYPAYLILLGLIILNISGKWWRSQLCSFSMPLSFRPFWFQIPDQRFHTHCGVLSRWGYDRFLPNSLHFIRRYIVEILTVS